MEAYPTTPRPPEDPSCQRLPMLSAPMQEVVADYLAYLRIRQYAASVQEGTIRALHSFATLLPAARQACCMRT